MCCVFCAGVFVCVAGVESEVVRQDLVDVVKDITEKPCFLLKNVLTKEECKLLIAAAENQGTQHAHTYARTLTLFTNALYTKQ